MKRLLVSIVVLLLLLFVAYRVDKALYMMKRVKEAKWMYDSGYRAAAIDLMTTSSYTFHGDTLVFWNKEKAVVRFQYFDRLIITSSPGWQPGYYHRFETHWK